MPELWVGCRYRVPARTDLMGRLRRFPSFRFIGRRDLMLVYDCDDDGQLQELSNSSEELSLDQGNLLQAFAPDSLAEARNRGFRTPD